MRLAIDGGHAEKDAKEMKGPSLARLTRQSALAPALLELAKAVLLSSPEYVERIKRHCTLFRGKIDGREGRGFGEEAPAA